MLMKIPHKEGMHLLCVSASPHFMIISPWVKMAPHMQKKGALKWRQPQSVDDINLDAPQSTHPNPITEGDSDTIVPSNISLAAHPKARPSRQPEVLIVRISLRQISSEVYLQRE